MDGRGRRNDGGTTYRREENGKINKTERKFISTRLRCFNISILKLEADASAKMMVELMRSLIAGGKCP
jgi:hypothetical protein